MHDLNIYIVSALLILKQILQKRGRRRMSRRNPGLWEVKFALKQFVRNWLLRCFFWQRILKITSGCNFTFHKIWYARRVVINCNVFTLVHSNCCGTGIAERFERWPPASVVKSILKRQTFTPWGWMHKTICGTLANSCCRNWTYGTLAQIMQCTEQSPLRFAILKVP